MRSASSSSSQRKKLICEDSFLFHLLRLDCRAFFLGQVFLGEGAATWMSARKHKSEGAQNYKKKGTIFTRYIKRRKAISIGSPVPLSFVYGGGTLSSVFKNTCDSLTCALSSSTPPVRPLPLFCLHTNTSPREELSTLMEAGGGKREINPPTAWVHHEQDTLGPLNTVERRTGGLAKMSVPIPS